MVNKNNKTTIQIKNTRRRVFNVIPKEILQNSELNQAISLLPKNYNFEIHKSIWRIQRDKAKRVALQFPEGLLIFSCIISDIIERFGNVDTFIMGDVTYGACCIDDFTAKSLKCDMMIHYGHSCLVPITLTKMPTLYVFVEIKLNTKHYIDTIKHNFPADSSIALGGTIQFVSSIHNAVEELSKHFKKVLIPQERPLSSGEVLGCTSPILIDNFDALIFVADGRFHLESLMINNPKIKKFFRYNPYDRKLTTESYDFKRMMKTRRESIEKSKKAQIFGVILSTLGRQGNPKILERVERLLKSRNKEYFVILLSEILPQKLDQFSKQVDAFIQIGCPRLSIDWGYSYPKPLLSPYEAFVALGAVDWEDENYPMDFYSKKGKAWSNYYSGPDVGCEDKGKQCGGCNGDGSEKVC